MINSTDVPVRVVGIELRLAHFEQLRNVDNNDFEPDLQFGLAVGRIGKSALGVELRVRFVENPFMICDVGYRGIFERDPVQNETDIEETEFWQNVAARMAPTVMYPYCRETVSTFLSKAGYGAAPPLPIIQAGRVFDPEGITIPAFVPEKPKATGDLPGNQEGRVEPE